ncbi:MULTISPECIES: hypothetical protein [unclassified Halobacteriovorax]|uniref:hypothetical protein n=2 Tax=unclassified Halobacteriovorax TaxID=2639665 RepID=UPI000CD308CF|nr:hypothetical protein C0Z22_08085 [Halobacteriovorax sp. DA5]
MVMRLKTLFILTSLSFSAVAKNSNDNQEARYLQVLTSQNPMFESAMSVPGVKDMYSECYRQESEKTSFNGVEVGNCLWGKIQADEGTLKQINKLVEKQSGKDGSGRYRTTMDTAKGTSKGLETLKQFLIEKLEKALYGEFDSKTGQYDKIASQKTFFELYKTQLGKNIISAATSYCIESKNYGYPLISEDESVREKVKNENLVGLNETIIRTDPNTGEQKQVLKSASNWEACIGNINAVCYAGAAGGEFKVFNSDPNNTQGEKKIVRADIINTCAKHVSGKDSDEKVDKCDSLVRYSYPRACNVIQYIELARQSITTTDGIAKKFEKLQGTDSLSNVKMYDSREKSDESIDALTTISSGEAMDAVAKGQKEEIAAMEECYKDGKIVDAEACKNFLSSNREEQYSLLGELKVQEEVTLQRLKDIEDNPEEVAKLLIEEGYTEDEAKNLATVQGVKDQIAKRYEAKKDAILQSLSDEIKKHTTKGDEFSEIEDLETIAALAEKTQKKAENFSKLVHFNNIVSSYLEIRSGDENEDTQRNTRALAMEMKNSILSEENREKYKEMGVDLGSIGYSADDLNEKFATTGMDYSESSNDDATLDVGDINTYLLSLFKGE